MTDYVKQTWADSPATTTPITAARLDVIESGIAYTSWGLPSYAGARKNLWQPDRSLYNFKASNTRFLRAATTAASADLGLCRIACIGDSLLAGYLATPGDTDPVTMFLRLLVRRGQQANALYHTWDGIAGDFIGVDTSANTGGGGENTTFPWTSVSTGTIAFTGIGTVLEIVSASGNGQPFFYSIDGGANVSVNVTTGGNHAVMTTITGLSDGQHTVTLSRNGASGLVYFLAGGFRYPTGIVVENAAITGTTTNDWVAQDGNYGALWSLLADTANPKRDVAFVELGANDFIIGGANTVANMKTNLATICQRLKASGTDPILVVANRPNGSAGWDAYAAGIYDVADTEDVPLLDMSDWFGPLATMVINGHDQGDGVHLTAKGGAHQGEAFGETILAEPSDVSNNAYHNVQSFTANGTWVKPAGAKTVQGWMLGGGGGGQAGARRASGTAAAGGGSGAGGGWTYFEIPASALAATQAVVVGAGGTAGAGATADNTTAGAVGGSGGQTTFAGFRAGGGTGGGSGTTAGTGTFAGGQGAAGAASAGTTPAITNSNAAPGGGTGGGITSAPAATAGGAGARMNSVATTVAVGAAGTSGGGAGGNGSSGIGYVGGTSGGGGGSSTTGVGGKGGDGGAYGAGAGGGGASLNGSASGAGGVGGVGICVLITKL